MRARNIADQRFGRLTALYPTQKRTSGGSVIWHCLCDCGNETDVSYNELCYTDKQSCGCLRRERDSLLHTHLTHIAGTSVDILKSRKVRTDNTTGVKGVYFIRGRYVAKIVFQQKQYYLGAYKTLEEAAEARQEAEETIAGGMVAHYEKWQTRAKADPGWAAANPVSVHITRSDSGRMQVCFLPEMEWQIPKDEKTPKS